MTDCVTAALAMCEAAQDLESSTRAYEALLSAVGNNHAGTYNSSALRLAEAIGPFLGSAGPWSQRAVLEALIDLYGSFEPEPDVQGLPDSQASSMFRLSIACLKPSIVAIAASGGAPSASAQELLELIHESTA